MTDPVARLNAALEGRYAIERELGEGGMAKVYLADDLKSSTRTCFGGFLVLENLCPSDGLIDGKPDTQKQHGDGLLLAPTGPLSDIGRGLIL